MYFDEDDFENIEKKQKEEKERKIREERERKIREEREKRIVTKPITESYKGKIEKEETKKVFKPTPIISPVYGVLDKNYTKEDITTKQKTNTISNKKTNEVNIDSVRNKAYGTLEEELINFDENVVVKSNHKDMEEYYKKMEEVDHFDEEDIKSLDKSLDERLKGSSEIVDTKSDKIRPEAKEVKWR